MILKWFVSWRQDPIAMLHWDLRNPLFREMFLSNFRF